MPHRHRAVRTAVPVPGPDIGSGANHEATLESDSAGASGFAVHVHPDSVRKSHSNQSQPSTSDGCNHFSSADVIGDARPYRDAAEVDPPWLVNDVHPRVCQVVEGDQQI